MREPSEAELFFHGAILHHKKACARQRKLWDKHVAMYRGDEPPLEDDPFTWAEDPSADIEDRRIHGDANWLYAFIDTLVATICPSLPAVTVRSPRKALSNAAKYRSALVSTYFDRDNMANKLRRLAARSALYPTSFLKVTWDKAKQRPRYRVLTPEDVWYDDTVDDWDDVRYVIQRVPRTKAEIIRRKRQRGNQHGLYDAEVVDAIDWDNKHPRRAGDAESDNKSHYVWTIVYEVWDLVGEKFYLFTEGCPVPLLAEALPYKEVKNPFVPCTFNDGLRGVAGVSDASLAAPTITRLNQLAGLRLWHVLTTIPVPVIHEGLVDDGEEFEEQYTEANGPGRVLKLRAPPNVNIRDVLGSTPTPNLPADFERAMEGLQEVVESVLALPRYARGQVGQADVATELALTDSAIKTRNSRRQRELYRVVELAAEYTLGLAAQYLKDEDEILVELDAAKEQEVYVSRQTMALGDEARRLFRYKANPYDARDDNSVVRLKAILETLQALTSSPHVNQRRLFQELLQLLKMDHLLNTEEEEAAAVAAAQGGAPNMASQMPGDIPAAPGMPDEISPLLQGGEIPLGDGGGEVPAGLEGGSVPAF